MQKNQSSKGLSASMLFRAVRRRKLLVAAPAVLLTAGFGLFALRMPERYRAQALVAVEPAAAQDYVKNRQGAPAVNVQDQMRAIRETLFSQPVLEQVVKEFRLTERADPEEPSWVNGIERLIGGFKLYAQSQGRPPEHAIEELKSRIAVQVEGPDAFYIAYQGESRQQVMDVTNRVAELFTKRASVIRDQRADEATGFMDAEVERLRRKLADQDERIRRYKQRAVHEMPEHLATNMRSYEMLQDQVSARAEKIAADQARRVAVLEEIRELERQGIQKTTAPRERTASEARLDDLRLRYREMQARYTPNHPELARLDREIKDLEKSVSRGGGRVAEPSPAYLRYLELKGEVQAIDQRLKSYGQEQRDNLAQRELYRKRVESAPEHERTIAQLIRDEEVTRAQYAALVDKLNEAKLDQRLDKMNKGLVFKVVEPAPLPEAPFTPHRGNILLAGFLASLLCGVALAVVVEQLDTSFDNIEDFQGFTNLPVLTVVPSIGREPESKAAPRGPISLSPGKPGSELAPLGGLSRDQLNKNRIVTLTDPGSIAAEQYGILAMKVRQKLDGASKVITVTSSAGGEGKTLTAVNLALALASSTEGRVLLVDADMRRPTVHEYLGLKPTRGFSELLQHIDDDPLGYTTKVKDLYVMSGGGKVSNPIGNLASRRARDLFARLREQFAVIILDSPPILPLADSHVLAGLADGVVLVVRARQTRRELMRRAVESFDVSNVFGVVLNDVDYQHSPYTYAYKYYQKHYLARQ